MIWYRSNSLLDTIQLCILSFGTLSVMIYATYQKINGVITTGDVVAIVAFVQSIAVPLSNIGLVLREFHQSRSEYYALLQLLADSNIILSKQNENVDVIVQPCTKPRDNQVPSLNSLDVRFEHVHLAIEGKEILHDVTFDIPYGRSVAFVGKSGSGKSSLWKLIVGVMSPTSGHVYIQGKSVQDWNLGQLRRRFAIVQQQPSVFRDTIQYNIEYGSNQCVSEEEFNECLLHAQIDTRIDSLPKRRNSVFGTPGVVFSGGEQQRLGIARAFVAMKHADVFIFDEATSALDSHTETKVCQHILARAQNKTSIYVAHRLRTITHVDLIVVMDGGNVIETGTHHELLGKQGLYAALWNEQAKDAVGTQL